MPDVEGLSANRPIRISGQEVAAWMEVAMDECGSEKDVLKPAQVVRTLHLPLAASCRPMGIFRAMFKYRLCRCSTFGRNWRCATP